MYHHILVPTDGSVVSARAEKAAIAMARKLGAAVTVVHVVAPYSRTAVRELPGRGVVAPTPEEYKAAAEKRGKSALRRVTARARRAGVRSAAILVTSRDPAEALVRAAARASCDLIVMGSNSRAGIQRIFLGSVAAEVLNGTKVPTLVCH